MSVPVGPLTALVVEDSPTMRQLIVSALRGLGNFQVVEANNGVDALKKLSSQWFDILLTDINMPMMDGLKLVSMVRRDRGRQGMPIVMITTEGAQEDKQRALSLGANAYLVKPVRAAAVVAKVKELLGLE
jgi:two-component system chemotaxis response regulator CheY